MNFAHWLFPFEGWLGSNKLSGDKLQPTASLSSVEHAISSLKNLVKCNNSLRLLSYHWLNFTVIILKCVLFWCHKKNWTSRGISVSLSLCAVKNHGGKIGNQLIFRSIACRTCNPSLSEMITSRAVYFSRVYQNLEVTRRALYVITLTIGKKVPLIIVCRVNCKFSLSSTTHACWELF